MADVPSVAERIQVEETDFRSPVSESLANKLGGTMNWILDHYTIPEGAVFPYAGLEASIPSGWFICDGRAISRATYANLFAVLSTRFGVGDGLTTFNIPDYRGYFLRGADASNVGQANRDPDHAARTAFGTGTATAEQPGSVQADQFRSHTHKVGTQAGGAGASVQSSGDSPQYLQDTQGTGGNETRPMNSYVHFIIKW